MSENIKTIKFTSICSILFALLTYIITLNMEIGFFQPNLSWMSNNFSLTICGGAFASFLVVMLCEIQKYRNNKLSCENYLYAQSIYLYSALYVMVKNVDDYITNQTQAITDNLIDQSIYMIRSQAIAIRNVDYVTFHKNNMLTTVHKEFCSNELIKLDFITKYGYYLKIAIRQTQKRNLEQISSQGVVTSADELVSQILVAIRKQVSPMLNDISNYIETIDMSCNCRYDWKKHKSKIDDSYVSLSKAGQFEDFLKQAEE